MNAQVDMFMDEIQWTYEALLREGISRKEATTVVAQFPAAFGKQNPFIKCIYALDGTTCWLSGSGLEDTNNLSQLWTALVWH